MSELDDLKLQEGPTAEPAGPEGGSRKRGGKSGWIVALVIVLLGAAAGVYYAFFRGGEAEPAPAVEVEPPSPPPAPPPAAEEEPQIELPPLAASDELVRRLAGELSTHPRLLAWLAGDELIRRFVATVDNVAEGVSPRPHLVAAAPEEPFPVLERDGETYLDPRGYRRYDTVTAVFASLDPEGTARLYRQLRPLIDQAYRDLGYPEADFGDTLTRAAARLLSTPVIEGEIRLEPKVTSYRFADPRLEALAPAQKNLLRIGPGNMRRIQTRLRALARALGIPAEKLPETPLWRAR